MSSAFFSAQAAVFGAKPTLGAILAKVAVDQFLWTPLYATHANTFIITFPARNFKLPVVSAAAAREYLLHQFVVTQIASWMVWVPACFLVYAMDVFLQLVMMNIVGVLYVIVVASIARPAPQPDAVFAVN